MNEKIQKLTEQANLEIDPAYPDHNQKVLEKFAELIVRECIETFMGVPPSYKDYRSQIEEAMRDYCVSVVKQHFGVK